MNKNWGLILIGVLGYIGFRKFLFAKNINVFYKGLDFSKISFDNPVLNLQLQINNPTLTKADLQNITGDLFVDDILIGSVFGINPITIYSGANVINIPVTLNYLGFGDLITKFKGNQFRLRFTGGMVVDFLPIPLDINYNL